MTSDLDLCSAFLEAHPDDAAQILERLPAEDAAALLDVLPARTSAPVFDRLTPPAAAECLQRMRAESAAAVLTDLRTDLAAALLRRTDEAGRSALLAALPSSEAGSLRLVLRYPEGTAGAVMDPRVMAVADDVTAGEALAQLRRSARHMLYYVYVVDRSGRLTGVVDVRELLLARAGDPLAGVMHRAVARLGASMPRAAILAHPGWRHFHALPVVDEDSALLGAVRYQTFRRLEEEIHVHPHEGDAVAAVFALGELYWLGLSGVVEGLASVVRRTPAREGNAEDAHATP